MSDRIQDERTKDRQISPSEAVGGVEGCQVTQEPRKGWFKKILPMGICCTAPLLLALAIPLFGASLGAVVSGFLSVAAVLACPLGMYLMMRMMNKR